MTPDFQLAKTCAALSQAAYGQCTFEGPRSTQVLIKEISGSRQGEEAESVQYVAFRGSQDLTDWLTDGEIWRQRLVTKMGQMEIHSGFNHCWAGIGARVMESLDPSKPVVVTGHSLGGALAMLCAFWLENASFDVQAVYTFGQPRVGDSQFAFHYDRAGSSGPRLSSLDPRPALVARTWRFVHDLDAVTRLPGVLIGYRHAGNEAFLTADGRVILNPSLPQKLWFDAQSVFSKWTKDGRLAALHLAGDHTMVHYLVCLGAPHKEVICG